MPLYNIRQGKKQTNLHAHTKKANDDDMQIEN